MLCILRGKNGGDILGANLVVDIASLLVLLEVTWRKSQGIQFVKLLKTDALSLGV